jgi:hypothetical protein
VYIAVFPSFVFAGPEAIVTAAEECVERLVAL